MRMMTLKRMGVAVSLLGCGLAQEFEMDFSSPELGDEEKHSWMIPQNMKCDACHAVSFQLQQGLEKGEQKMGSTRRARGEQMREEEYIPVLEKACRGFNDYGIKTIKGNNRLSGPGTEHQDTPGMMMGGGSWPGKLTKFCEEMVGEVTEEELYERFREGADIKSYLCLEEGSKPCAEKKRGKKRGKKKPRRAKKAKSKEEL